MPSWLKSRLGTSIAAGTLAVGVVGGLAFAVAGPIMGSTVSSSAPPASPAAQAATGGQGRACRAAAAAGATAGAPAAGSSAASSSACARGMGVRRLLERTEHASLIVRGKGGTWVTVTLDKGSVQSISPSSITIVRPDGVSVTAPISSTTRFRRTSEASLAEGDRVLVVQAGGTTRGVILLGTGAGAGAGGGSSTTS